MSETQQLKDRLIARIKALAEQTNRSVSTVSAKVLGGGNAVAELEAGRSITFATFDRAMATLDALEAAADRPEAA